MNRKMLMNTAACLTASLAIGGAVAAADAGDEAAVAPPAGSERFAAGAAPVASIEPEQADELAPLRRERTTDDALPEAWRNEIRDETSEGEGWGANPSLSRKTAPGVWLVPGKGYVCLANATAGEGLLGFGCAAAADVDRGFLAPSDVDAHGTGVVTGVVPDGVPAVELVARDGSARTVAVERNTYRAAIDAELREIRFTDPGGVQRVLPMAWSR